MQNNNKTVEGVRRRGGEVGWVGGGGRGGAGARGGRGRQRINAINLQLITHQLTPGQLVASEQPDNMQNACEPCVYTHARVTVSLPLSVYTRARARVSFRI